MEGTFAIQTGGFTVPTQLEEVENIAIHLTEGHRPGARE